MTYEDLKKTLEGTKSELPLNRKEKFYTATVLPSILFHSGLSNFYRFLSQIEGLPKEITEMNTRWNFLFYTEYNLKQSAGSKNVGAKIPAKQNHTPDVVIEILEPMRLFIIIEAKMFQTLSQTRFNRQMTQQRFEIIDRLRDHYGLSDDRMFHVALVPERLGFMPTRDYQLITWDSLLKDSNFDLKGNYFCKFLEFALEHYDKLVEGNYRKDQIAGKQALKKWKSGEALWIGRQGGKSTIQDDIKKGDFENRMYHYGKRKPRSGKPRNWIDFNELAEFF